MDFFGNCVSLQVARRRVLARVASPLSLLLCAVSGGAQLCPRGRVVDPGGAAVPGAQVTGSTQGASGEIAIADVSGSFAFRCAAGWDGTGTVRARARGLESQPVPLHAAGEEIVLTVRPTALQEQVTVLASRSAVTLGPQAETMVALSANELQAFPALTLDERLRQVAGYELFRRSSSWATNPTSQGVSLRGLGSTAVSRTLVLADGAPLNDAFGGWIHWNEIPPDALEGVTVATGGGSDLYGSSALGGVIDVVPAHPGPTIFTGTLAGAAEDTTDGHGRFDLQQGRWGESVAGEGFRTAGYVPIAPELQGAIDRASNVHAQNGRVVLERRLGNAEGNTPDRFFLTANLLNEARGNGTALQTNGTRLWRWLAGDDWSAGARATGRVRVFGSDQAYRQTFSSINAARSVETLTRLQNVETQEVGGAVDGAAHWSHAAIVVGADLRDLRANDAEQPTTGASAGTFQDTTARQRFAGGFVEGLGTWGHWSGSASVRVDGAENLDTRTATFTRLGLPSGAAGHPADRTEIVVSPRVGLVRTLPRGFELHAAGFRAFRTPTMNELYRSFQVGQEITQANAALTSERATGAEGGVGWHPGNSRVGAEATYFWTEINRPVSAVLLSSTPTSITNRRENLGQIQSEGVELRVRLNEGHAISGAAGYQYAHAVVTQFSAQPSLVGTWTPDVPRHSFTAQLRAARARWGVLTLAARASGQAYDDSANTFPLHRFFAMDVYGERGLGRGWSAFLSVQNVLNQRMEVARTPLLTLGNPVLAQGGVRFGWGGH